MLGKYDPKQQWFGEIPFSVHSTSLGSPAYTPTVGATTEAKNQLDQFGRMAFGGAGMLVSDPLMSKMYDIWDSCYEQFRHHFGGELLLLPVSSRACADCVPHYRRRDGHSMRCSCKGRNKADHHQ